MPSHGLLWRWRGAEGGHGGYPNVSRRLAIYDINDNGKDQEVDVEFKGCSVVCMCQTYMRCT